MLAAASMVRSSLSTSSIGLGAGRRLRLVHQAEQRLDRQPLGVVQLPAGEVLGDRIQVLDPALDVGGDDAVADRGERHLRALLLGEQLGRGELLVGDVGERARDAHRLVGGVAHGLAAHAEPAVLARSG